MITFWNYTATVKHFPEVPAVKVVASDAKSARDKAWYKYACGQGWNGFPVSDIILVRGTEYTHPLRGVLPDYKLSS